MTGPNLSGNVREVPAARHWGGRCGQDARGRFAHVPNRVDHARSGSDLTRAAKTSRARQRHSELHAGMARDLDFPFSGVGIQVPIWVLGEVQIFVE